MTENFEELLQSIPEGKNFEGFLTKGTIVRIENDMAVIDAGLKAEGRLPLADLIKFEERPDLKVGDDVAIYVDKLEDYHGDIVFSAEKAFREKVWLDIGEAVKNNTTIKGTIFSYVKAGFAVNIKGIVGFLPKSQFDVRPIKDIDAIMNTEEEFKVIKLDRARNNVVLSRRMVLEESRAGAREKFVQDLEENQVVEGVIKNVTDYGAFVDLGGVDGLLHVIDISWKRINHPSDVLKVGDTVKVKVIRFNRETGRISLGMKQLESDPWSEIKDQIKVGDVIEGEVTNLTDYGAFVEIEQGIEGLIYVTEISWVKKNAHPAEFLKQGQKIKVMVMDVDTEKRRVSLSYKRCQPNPWQAYLDQNPPGSVVEGTIRNITEFGIFVGLTNELDGMVHLNDVSWDNVEAEAAIKAMEKGQKIKVQILEISPDRERISLGIKQLTKAPEKVQAEG